MEGKISVVGQIIAALADRVVAILLFAGVLVFILGIARGIQYNGWLPIDQGPLQYVGMAFGVMLIAAGVYLHTKAPMQFPDGKAFGIKISSPEETDSVDVVNVKGTITRKLPENYKLMVLRIYPKEGNAIYPLKPEVRIKNDGKTWVAYSCVVGGPRVSADQLKIGIYLVGPSGKALINYFRDAERTYKSNIKLLKPGAEEDFQSLPHIRERTNDMIMCDEVFVYSK